MISKAQINLHLSYLVIKLDKLKPSLLGHIFYLKYMKLYSNMKLIKLITISEIWTSD